MWVWGLVPISYSASINHITLLLLNPTAHNATRGLKMVHVYSVLTMAALYVLTFIPLPFSQVPRKGFLFDLALRPRRRTLSRFFASGVVG